MASLRDVGDALRRALDKIDQSIVVHHQAADLAEQASELLSAAGSGSNQADVDEACAWFTRVVEGITEPEGQVSTLATAADEIRSYLHRHGISHENTYTAEPVTTPAPVAVAALPAPGSPAHVNALRAQLPPPVQPGTGQRTHGRWFVNGRDQVSEMVSGQGPESVEAWKLLQDTDFPEPGPPVTVTHVETKVAVTMRRENIQHATVVLNNRPCRDRYGCDTVVPVLLPEGSTLTVHAPNYRKTYTGGMRAPWQL